MVVYRKRQTKQNSRTEVPVAMITLPSTGATDGRSKVEKSPEEETSVAYNAVGGNMYGSPQNNDGSSPAITKPNPPPVIHKGRHSLMPQ